MEEPPSVHMVSRSRGVQIAYRPSGEFSVLTNISVNVTETRTMKPRQDKEFVHPQRMVGTGCDDFESEALNVGASKWRTIW